MISLRQTLKYLNDGILNSSELASVSLERIELFEPYVNALIYVNDHFREEEFNAGMIRQNNQNKKNQDFLGVPLLVKDSFITRDQPTSFGTTDQYYTLDVLRKDAELVKAMKNLGFVVLGKTSLPRYGDDVQTYNDLKGICNNPWNLKLTSGGSSGGTAVGVSLGYTSVGLGSDLAGSLRIPANFCGVVSLKPTEGTLSSAGHFPFIETGLLEKPILTTGLITKTVDDLSLVYEPLLRGLPPRSPLPHIKGKEEGDTSKSSGENPKIGVVPSLPAIETDQRIVELISERLVKNLQRISTPETIPHLQFDHKELVRHYTVIANYSSYPKKKTQLTMLYKAFDFRAEFTKRIDSTLSIYDFLILPVSPSLAFPHNLKKKPILINNKEISYWKATISYTAPFSLTGHPVLTIPVGFIGELPVGVQLVGRHNSEADLLAFGRKMEEVMDLDLTPPLVHTAEPQEEFFLERFEDSSEMI